MKPKLIFPWYVWLVIGIAPAAALQGCGSAPIAAAGSAVQFYDAPCDEQPVLELVPEDKRHHLKQAWGIYGGREYAVCYAEENGDVLLIWEDGGMGALPGILRGKGD